MTADYMAQVRTVKQHTKNGLTRAQVRSFRNAVYGFYKINRRSFPWRNTKNPYRILVSEVMLQQTQADRVVEKYRVFIKTFPTVQSLAAAPLASVLLLWQGLGYNRRARMLKASAKRIVGEFGGRVPSDAPTLSTLSGIGPYTAAAIAAFAFNRASVVIETNIRSVFIHHFFPTAKKVDDARILPLIEATLDAANPREWYSALMDYGAHLKKIHPNPSRRSAHHARQSTFAGSNRQLRGNIIKLLLKKSATLASITKILREPALRVRPALLALAREGMVERRGSLFCIG